MKPIEIFRAGRHTAMSGESLSFGEAELAAAAAAYDPARHEAPLVVGHPQDGAPAYGWVKSLAFADGPAGGSLTATPDQVEPAFAELVQAGRFKKVSASFYRPDAAENPAPGAWYLRHVGFLGAQPPALKGLKPIEFAADAAGTVTIEFADWNGGWTVRSIAGLFRGLRDWLVEKEGAETADRIVPSWTLDDMLASAARPEPAATPAAFAERTPAVADTEQKAVTPPAAATEELERERRQIAEERIALKRERAADFAERQVAAGRLTPGQKEGAIAFMAALDDQSTVDFAEGKRTPLAWFRGFLEALPTAIDFGERSRDPQQGAGADALTPEQLAAKALEFVEAEKAKGRTVTVDQAVRLVSKPA